MQNAKVSILILTYNRSTYLDKAIQSVLDQTYKNVETIVINHGSTDNTNQILEKYGSAIRVITKEQGKIPSALNSGIASVTGEWVRLIGDDDLLYPSGIEIMMEEVEKFKEDAKSIIFYSSLDFIDRHGNILFRKEEPDYNSLNEFDRNVILLNRCYANFTTALFHKSVFDRCGNLSPQFGLVFDYEFFLRCCLQYNYKLYLVPFPTIGYRKHAGQESLKHDVLMEETEEAKNEVLNRIEPSLKKKYLSGMKKYARTAYPPMVILRRKARDLFLKTLSEKKREKLVNWYLRKKGLQNYYGLYIPKGKEGLEKESGD